MLYKVIAAHLETFLAALAADPDAKGLPAYVQREFFDYLPCGILAHGFLRLGCDTCKQEILLPCSCKRRGVCPSCAGRRMAQTTAHLVERVIPWVPTRQWVVSVPMPLRYWLAASQDLTAKVHTIIRTTITQYDVPQPALHSRLWNCWRSWQRWYRYRASIWCGMGAVWRRTGAGRGC